MTFEVTGPSHVISGGGDLGPAKPFIVASTQLEATECTSAPKVLYTLHQRQAGHALNLIDFVLLSREIVPCAHLAFKGLGLFNVLFTGQACRGAHRPAEQSIVLRPPQICHVLDPLSGIRMER